MYRRGGLVLVSLALLLASACGASSDDASGVASLATPSEVVGGDTSAGDALELTAEERLLAFAQCMRDQGIDIDDPTVDADGNVQLSPPAGDGTAGGGAPSEADRELRRVAADECGESLEGAGLGFRAEDRTAIEDQLLAFAQCMRDNGIDMEDPDLGAPDADGSGPGGGPFGDVDFDDPAFRAAQEACADILAGFAPGGGRFGGGPPGAGGTSNG